MTAAVVAVPAGIVVVDVAAHVGVPAVEVVVDVAAPVGVPAVVVCPAEVILIRSWLKRNYCSY